MYTTSCPLEADSGVRDRFDMFVDLLATTPEHDQLAPSFAIQFNKLSRIFVPDAGSCTPRTLRRAAEEVLAILAQSSEGPAIAAEFCHELDNLLTMYEKMCRICLLVEKGTRG